MNNCFFCLIQKNKQRVFFSSKYFIAIFDGYPVSPGHALIISKAHKINLSELNEKEWLSLKSTISNVIKKIESTDLKKYYSNELQNSSSSQIAYFLKKALNHPKIGLKPDAYNHGINDGVSAGRTINHLHWHIIPRYMKDIKDPTGGVRCVIPQLSNYKKM